MPQLNHTTQTTGHKTTGWGFTWWGVTRLISLYFIGQGGGGPGMLTHIKPDMILQRFPLGCC